MAEREKVIRGLECHGKGSYEFCKPCPYHYDGCEATLCRDALALIQSLQEDIEVWKNRYKWVAIERKTADDFNKEPNIVKVFTTEEMERMEMKRDG